MNAAQFSRERERIERDSHAGANFQRRAFSRLVERARAIRFIVSGKVLGWRLPDGSMVCAKRRFIDQPAAIAYMLAIQAQDGKRNAPRRSYQCEFCKGWHLTSRISIKEE